MAIDSRIALGVQAPDTNTAIRGGLLNADTFNKMREDKKNAPLRNKLLQTQTEGAELALDQSKMKLEAQSVLSGIDTVDRLLDSDDIEGVQSYLNEREGEILGRDGDATHTQNFKTVLAAGPQEGETPEQFKSRIKTELNNEREGIYNSGLVKRPALSKTDEDLNKRIIEDTAAGTKDIKKRAGEINTAFNKIEGLASQMDADGLLPRTAINAGIMSLARMISPGVVTEKDAAAIAGVSTPAQAILEMFKQGMKNAETPEEKAKFERAQTDFVRSFDPANPETFNIEGFKAIAKTVAGAEAQTIKQQWDELSDQYKRSGVGKRGYDTYFGGADESISGLDRFAKQDSPAPSLVDDNEVDSLINKYAN